MDAFSSSEKEKTERGYGARFERLIRQFMVTGAAPIINCLINSRLSTYHSLTRAQVLLYCSLICEIFP